MSWLLDTSAVSELAQPKRNSGFQSWWDETKTAQGELFLCAPVIAEIERSARNFVSHKRRIVLEWLHTEVLPTFATRILPFDVNVARTWGEITSVIPKDVALSVMDSYIAAIAIHHDLTLVTKNPKEMAAFETLKTLTPWS